MTPGGLPYAAAWLCWAAALLANGTILLHFAPGLDTGRVLRLAIGAIVGGVVLLVAAMLGLWAAGAHPTPRDGSLLFSVFFTMVTMAMTNIGNAFFRFAADTVTAFHVEHNAANLHRFPISVLTGHRASLDRVAAMAWSLGAGLMFYGVWFDMRI